MGELTSDGITIKLRRVDPVFPVVLNHVKIKEHLNQYFHNLHSKM